MKEKSIDMEDKIQSSTIIVLGRQLDMNDEE